MFEERYFEARAYRQGRLLCGDLLITVSTDVRIAFVPAMRRLLSARFLGEVDRELGRELERLRRAPWAWRLRVASEPLDVVLHAPRGEQRIDGCRLLAPRTRSGRLADLEYRLREREPAPG